mmetsp:Transcript_51028/g.136094  ORF Transcript_51028/g.136094 Transcript_51028/m.136094 type:complete len:359 (-) Transcript_51028:44-1120(-)
MSDDDGLVLCQHNQTTNLFDHVVRSRKEKLLLGDEANLARPLVTDHSCLVSIYFDRLLLPTRHELVIWSWKDNRFPTMHDHLASIDVQERKVLMSLQNPSLRHRLSLPSGFKKDLSFPFLHPPLSRRYVLQSHVLVLLQCDRRLLRLFILVRFGEPDTGSSHCMPLSCQALLHGQLFHPVQDHSGTFRNQVMWTWKPHASSSHDSLFSREFVSHFDVLRDAQTVRLATLHDFLKRSKEDESRPALDSLSPSHGVRQMQKRQGPQRLPLDDFRTADGQGVEQDEPWPVVYCCCCQPLNAELFILTQKKCRSRSEPRNDRNHRNCTQCPKNGYVFCNVSNHHRRKLHRNHHTRKPVVCQL